MNLLEGILDEEQGRRMKLLSMAAALLGLSLVFAGCKPAPITHGVEYLVSVGTNQVSASGSNDLPRVIEVLKKRMDKFGWRSSMERVADDRIVIKLARKVSGDEALQVRTVLTKGGFLEFRLVHVENEQMMRDNIVPSGFMVMMETRVSPTGQKTVVPLLVSKQRLPGLSGRNIKSAGVTRGGMNEPQIMFRFDSEGAAAFAKVTAENIHRKLAIILDGQVYSAPVIKSPITGGSGAISGSFTDEEALEFAGILQFPLEATVQLITETIF